MDPPVVLPPTIDEIPPPGMALVEELDKLLMVQLRDGRKILGTLRSFDQFANLVLEAARERIIVGQQFGEVPLGLHVVRGENVVLLGEVDAARDPPPGLELVSEAEIRRAQKAEREADKMKGTLRARFDFLDD
eukprot:scaffold5.g1008.t1